MVVNFASTKELESKENSDSVIWRQPFAISFPLLVLPNFGTQHFVAEVSA